MHGGVKLTLGIALAGDFNPILALARDILVVSDGAIGTLDSHPHSYAGGRFARKEAQRELVLEIVEACLLYTSLSLIHIF